jgi:hypothetical protein
MLIAGHLGLVYLQSCPDDKEVEKTFIKSIAERQHTPILEGLNALAEEKKNHLQAR